MQTDDSQFEIAKRNVSIGVEKDKLSLLALLAVDARK